MTAKMRGNVKTGNGKMHGHKEKMKREKKIETDGKTGPREMKESGEMSGRKETRREKSQSLIALWITPVT